MKAGGGKQKGSAFERQVCRSLSLWITDKKLDSCLWRSAMSGGRATVAHKKGKTDQVVGDICAVTEEGNAFANIFMVECKNYKYLDLAGLICPYEGDMTLSRFWSRLTYEAEIVDKKPMLIFKSNRIKPRVLMNWHDMLKYVKWVSPSRLYTILTSECIPDIVVTTLEVLTTRTIFSPTADRILPC